MAWSAIAASTSSVSAALQTLGRRVLEFSRIRSATSQVGAFVHVDVTVADTGLDGGHLRVADHRVDQAGAAARDDHVDQAAGLDQVRDGGPIGGRKQLDRVGRQILADQRGAQHVDERLVGLSRPTSSRAAARRYRT